VSYKPVTSLFLGRKRVQDTSSFVVWRLRSLAALRIIFGSIWALDAWFKWQPSFANYLAGYLTQTASSQLSAHTTWMTFGFQTLNLNPHFFANLIAITETGTALGLILGTFKNLTCSIGIFLSLLLWSVAGGFGRPYGQGATDIGIVIISVLVFTGLLLSDSSFSFGLDRYLAVKLGHKNFLASNRTKTRQKATVNVRSTSDRQRSPKAVPSKATSTHSRPRPKVVKEQRLLPM